MTLVPGGLPMCSIGLCYQRCHSEKMKNPRWANTKTQENPRSNFLTILGKKSTFPEKTTFSEKNLFLSDKNSDDLFLVINSHFQIFARHFQIFARHFQIFALFRPKFTPEFLEIRYF